MYMSIDPGIVSGVVVWSSDWEMDAAEVVTPRGINWQTRSEDLCQRVRSVRARHGSMIQGVFCEYPAFMQSHGGQTAARRGDLVKLAVVCGMLRMALDEFLVGQWHWISVDRWKGQLPKSVVNARLRRKLGRGEIALLSKNESHDWDAAGIGVWARENLA